ncbi:hypothetical protein [Estrella lausannensis]|uniref:Putative membrane protein n=1 Tax=Estrella lausannensis TaxID=483423 RepID=A0A0H5DRJ0_9BACT|nr:hypothetical protein [Estrella lausannensis]CRX38818.1 putative membrane protein [Estrella lausannensis]
MTVATISPQWFLADTTTGAEAGSEGGFTAGLKHIFSKIWQAVCGLFSAIGEFFQTPPGMGLAAFVGFSGIGWILLAVAESAGMEGDGHKMGRILLKIAAAAAFILSGAALASGIIFGIV